MARGRTQLKLQQLTGSIGNAAGKIRTDVAKSAIASIVAVDTYRFSGRPYSRFRIERSI